MATLKIKNVRIAGISAGVPKSVINNLEIQNISKDYDAKSFVETTGVIERRVSQVLTTSDLCKEAAERLIGDIKWDKSDIEALIFISQTRDYIEPATACILQDKLGLSKDCYCLDVSLGCSAWVYGLSMLASLMQMGQIKKGLLCVGDAKRLCPLEDDAALFGHAGTVTALEYDEDSSEMTFDLGTDGSGYDAIIIPDGGARNPFTEKSLVMEDCDGKMLNRLMTHMKGMDVFSFGITTAPKSIKKVAKEVGGSETPWLDYDYYILHQANMKMNEFIIKKLKLPKEKVPFSMPYFGNTSSASIPLTIVTQLKGKIENCPTKLLCCGFGIGLSWGSVSLTTNRLVISDLVEV